MKYISIMTLAVMTSCSMLPWIYEEVKEVVEFEEDAIRDEIKIREMHHNQDLEKIEKQCKAALHRKPKPLNFRMA